jgi:branched-chain amino acid transport system substrate-binding protein
MQNQSSNWLDIRRDNPDFLVMYGWGAMNPTAIKEAVKAEFPMEKFVSIWWPNDADAASAGDGAKGFKTLNWHGAGTNYPALTDIKAKVIDAGKSQTPKDEVGQVLYNRGVYNSMLIAEAIAQAQKITGKKAVTGEDVRRGLENLNLDAARQKEIGLDGFAVPFKTTCADHNSHSATFVQQWDGAKWVKVSDLVTPDTARVQPLLDEAAKAYAEKNAGWPARTEPCDNK